MAITKPKLLIATPAYGGLFTLQYVESLLGVQNFFGRERIPVGTYFMGNESLITRARNACATLAMEKFDKLLFIDSDVGFKEEDVAKLYYSEKRIVGGLYPHKTYPITLNYNPLLGATDIEVGGEVEVDHIATGFLMIDCSVFRELAKKTPKYSSSHIKGQSREYYDFFRCGAGLLESAQDYLSEDWYFCETAKRLGIKSYANLSVTLTHTGSHTFLPTEVPNVVAG